jgi:cell division protein FtsB
MAQFKKREEYRFWHSPLFLAVLFFAVILFAYNMIGLIAKERETQNNKVLELNKIDDLNKRQASLSTDIAKLQTPEGKEESIRDKFQVVKPGEKMVVIVDPAQQQATMDDQTVDHSFWGYIKRMFVKKLY